MVKTDCHKCEHKQEVPGNQRIEVPGNYYIKCTKPDHEMTGNARGISNGWFIYPHFFDPVWMTKECKNYSPKGGGNPTGDPCENQHHHSFNRMGKTAVELITGWTKHPTP